LTIPDAMGLGLYFSEGEGPKFKNPIQNLQDIEKLPNEINNDLTYVFDGVSTIKKA
jgi:uroporphyrinogen decarboxylase